MRKANFGAPVYYQNVVNSAALQTFPSYDTLNSGASLAQISKLYSANGQYYLTPENQGNVAIYAASGATAFRTSTYYNTGGPYTFYMQKVLPPAPPSDIMLWPPSMRCADFVGQRCELIPACTHNRASRVSCFQVCVCSQ